MDQPAPVEPVETTETTLSSSRQVALPIIILLVVIGLMIVATMPSGPVEADHYQRFQDGKSLYALLSSRIASGDSLQDVEGILGTGIPVTEDAESVRTEIQKRAQWYPAQYPNGVSAGDTFLRWPLEGDAVTLQFRDGYLVHHNPSSFGVWYGRQDVGGRSDLVIDPSGPQMDIGGRTDVIELIDE